MEEFTALIAWAAQALAAWSQANPILAEGVSFACRLLAPMLTLLILVRTIRSLLTVPAQPEVWAVLGLPNGVKVPLTRWENIMGRSPSADVVVNYPSVSRQHAAIIRRGDDADWTVYDLGSKMGTSVNGQPVEGSAPVTVGDTVELGGLKIDVLRTPGHTPGSVTLRVEDVLLTGDTLFCGSCGRTDFPGGSYADMQRSLKRLADLPGNYRVYPGHEGSTTLDYERKYNPFMQRL